MRNALVEISKTSSSSFLPFLIFKDIFEGAVTVLSRYEIINSRAKLFIIE
jgi:hypothetical protein